MHRQEDLHDLLCNLIGNEHVYYQSPTNTKMNYPAIVYSKARIESRFANDAVYSFSHRYEITVIDKRPDNPVIYELLRLPYCSFDAHYKADNLNHDRLTLYF